MVESGKELQVQLQNVMKENKALEENYQQEKIENKNKRQQLDHTMKELERNTVKENSSLLENYKEEKMKHKNAREELDQEKIEKRTQLWITP
eukprot:XP_011618353.1 PREDICTED: early endosome antigen 1-like [Takifugu rubripes]